MGNSALAPAAKYPILLDKQHHLTRLLIMDAHKRVFHNGVKETLVASKLLAGPRKTVCEESDIFLCDLSQA